MIGFKDPLLQMPLLCPLCGIEMHPLCEIPTDRLEEPFLANELLSSLTALRYRRCATCGLLMASDERRNDELLGRLYRNLPSEYWSSLACAPKYYARLESYLWRFATGTELCDIGCGDGLFLATLSPRWNKHGLDPAERAVAQCQARRLNVEQASLASWDIEERYDVITFMDAIEHLLNPLAELQTVHRALRPAGILLVVTGNASAWTSRLAGQRWAYLGCAGHVSVFSRKALSMAFEKSGFEILLYQTWQHDYHASVLQWCYAYTKNLIRGLVLKRYQPALPYCWDHQLVIARKC